MTRHYHVGHNIPGYLPESDVYYAEDALTAKSVLISDIDYAGDSIFDVGEDEDERGLADEYSAAMEDLNLTNVTDGYSVTLPTSTSKWDLGIAYWLAPCDEDCEDDDE